VVEGKRWWKCKNLKDFCDANVHFARVTFGAEKWFSSGPSGLWSFKILRRPWLAKKNLSANQNYRTYPWLAKKNLSANQNEPDFVSYPSLYLLQWSPWVSRTNRGAECRPALEPWRINILGKYNATPDIRKLRIITQFL